MNLQLAVILLMLAASVAMFVANRPRMDAVALLVIVAMPFTGVMTMNEALAGFADSAIILIGALFVIGEGLVRTGVARRLGDWLDAQGGGSEAKLLVLLMAAVAGLGSVMSSTAVVAMFIPVVLRISQNRGLSPGQLMMPLSMAALISGMLTLVATAPNLVVNAELIREGGAGFSFFSFTPFGLPILALGILYMLVGRRLLRSGQATLSTSGRPTLRDWTALYQLGQREQRVVVRDHSPLIGQTVDALRLGPQGVKLLAIERGSGLAAQILRPTDSTRIAAADTLLIDTDPPLAEIDAICAAYGVDRIPFTDAPGYFGDFAQDIGMVEVILPADSVLIGQTVQEARIRSEYGLTVVGLRHGRKVVTGGLPVEPLKVGDTLLLVGFWSDIRALRDDRADMVILNMPAEFDEVLPAARKAPHALGVLGLVVALMVSGAIPNVQAALIGCLLMGLSGCIDFRSAYGSISWKTLILIIGMLPFSLALQRTGGVELAAEAVIQLVGSASPRFALAVLFVITAGLGLFISNTATAVLMAPVGLAVAKDLALSPYPFAMTIALAASTAFMTPISSPVNTLVVGPGRYVFGDFVKVGGPFSILVAVVSVLMVPLWLPF
ncbi:MAG: SLC13 family permease [Acetobacteraceae bacterium]